MILMWLGSFVLMMFGWVESQKHLALMFSSLQRSRLDKGFEAKMPKLFQRALDTVLLEASPQKSLYSAMAFYNLKILDTRPSCLIMCLSVLGSWWALILGFLFLNFNGFFLLGLCSLGLAGFWQNAKVKLILRWAFATGIFLVGAETMLRNSTVIQTFLGQSDWAFFLADGRFASVLWILFAGMVLSFLIEVEFWSLFMALSLLATGTLSFNGGLALVAGERIGRLLVFAYRTRSLSPDCRRMGLELSLSSILGVFVGFWIAGELRSLLDLGFVEMSSFQERTLQFVLLFIVILLGQWMAQMVWGHFGGRRTLNEMQEGKYFSARWSEMDLLSTTSMRWAQEKIHKRLSEIRYHLQGLQSLKEGQVPEHIQARLKLEESELTLLDQSLKG